VVAHCVDSARYRSSARRASTDKLTCWGIWLTAGTRLLSIVPALPVLMEPGAPAGAVPVVAVQIPLTIVSVVLLLLGSRRRG
jgi:hypothetical protein